MELATEFAATNNQSQTVLDTITHRLERVKTSVNSLPGDVRRWYEAIPARCWMTERNQAKLVKTRVENIRHFKSEAISRDVLNLETYRKWNRKNLVHVTTKWESYYYLEEEALRDDSLIVDDDVIDYRLVNNMDWNLFENYSSDDLNRMPKIELVQFYQTVGFLVLPTTYVVNKISGDEKPICSCHRKELCKSPGKHPVLGYKFLTPANYPADKYLQMFRDNPYLNVGAKLYGYSILDFDGRNGGFETYRGLSEFTKAEGEFPLEETLKIKTPGGFHIFVKDEAIGNHADFFGRGADVRSERGFHVLPGSLHKSGVPYLWESTGIPGYIPSVWYSENSEDFFPTAGRKLGPSSHVNNRTKLRSISLKDVEKRMAEGNYVIPKGYREPTLYKFAAREHCFGKSKTEVFEILVTIRDAFCEDVSTAPNDADLKRLVEHVSQYDTNAEKLQPFKESRKAHYSEAEIEAICQTGPGE